MGVSLAQKVGILRKTTGGSIGTGWMHDEVCWLLHGLIRFYRPSLVIQTGHLWGKSALVVLDALEEHRLIAAAWGTPAMRSSSRTTVLRWCRAS